MPPPVAELIDVHKRYGSVEALRGVSLGLKAGSIVVLLGPNGAGKSTAMNLLLGLRRPDRGSVRLFGRDPGEPAARLQLGATPQDTAFPARLRCREVIEFVRRHYPAPLPTAELATRFGLGEFLDRQTGGLSGGQRRRLGLALAFAGQAPLVLLDEPTTGLDAAARRRLWQTLREHAAGGGTLLLSTHYLEEAEALADRIVLIDHGQVLLDGSLGELRARVGEREVHFRAAALPDLDGVVSRREEDGVHCLRTADADALVRELVERGVGFRDLEVRQISLEEAVAALLPAPEETGS